VIGEQKTSQSAGDGRKCNLLWKDEFEYFGHTATSHPVLSRKGYKVRMEG
jgi:hypothetical protein